MRILIVEDEPSLLEALKKTLRDEGYAVDVAEDGEEGLYKARTWDYDAIVLDVMLPKKDGWEVLCELRRARNARPASLRSSTFIMAAGSAPHRARPQPTGAGGPQWSAAE